MFSYVLICIVSAIVACGIIQVINNFVQDKLGTKGKTILAIIVEAVVSLILFVLYAIVAKNGVFYSIIAVLGGILITIGFTQVVYVVVKLLKKKSE